MIYSDPLHTNEISKYLGNINFNLIKQLWNCGCGLTSNSYACISHTTPHLHIEMVLEAQTMPQESVNITMKL